jgi:hypothetical protein
MPKDYSPFTPGVPVPVEFFVGRQGEVERLKNLVAASASGRVQVAFLTGERGIGKSSLASLVKSLVEQDQQYLGVHTFLGGVRALEEMTRRVFDRLVKDSLGRTWQHKLREFLGAHIRQVGLFSVNIEFEAEAGELRRLVNDFAPSLQALHQKLRDDRRGIFIILDDINGLAVSEEFANWLKSLVDEIATSGPRLPLCLLLVGLEERRQSLIHLNPSLARVFALCDIQAWTAEETGAFFRAAFERIGTKLTPEALEIMTRFAGGLPVLAHEIGDAAFKTDIDQCVDEEDATVAVFEAADIVGAKHLEPQVFRAIRSPHYRSILRKLADERYAATFHRADLLARLAPQETRVLDNFLNRMRKLGAVVPDEEAGRGAYRFANQLHALYFRMEAQRAKSEKPA